MSFFAGRSDLSSRRVSRAVTYRGSRLAKAQLLPGRYWAATALLLSPYSWRALPGYRCAVPPRWRCRMWSGFPWALLRYAAANLPVLMQEEAPYLGDRLVPVGLSAHRCPPACPASLLIDGMPLSLPPPFSRLSPGGCSRMSESERMAF